MNGLLSLIAQESLKATHINLQCLTNIKKGILLWNRWKENNKIEDDEGKTKQNDFFYLNKKSL